MEKKIINTPDAPEPIGPYNQAVLAGNIFTFQARLPSIRKTNIEATDIFEETHQVMHNLRAVLHAAELDFNM